MSGVIGLRHMLLLAAGAVLAGCSVTAVPLVDKTLSHQQGRDCTVANALYGEAICPDTRPVTPETEIFCYRTIANVECFTDPDPYQRAGTTDRREEVTDEITVIEGTERSPRQTVGGRDTAQTLNTEQFGPQPVNQGPRLINRPPQ